MSFKKTRFNQTAVSAQYKPSKELLDASDTEVPKKGRKSLEKADKGLGKEGFTTPSLTLNVLPFLPIICCVHSFRRYAIDYMRSCGGGVAKLKNEAFVLLCYIALFGGVGLGVRVASRGVSVSKLCLLYYGSASVTNSRNMNYTLECLMSFGLVERYGIANGYKYTLSVAAEKLFTDSVSRDAMRSLRSYVREACK